MMYTGDRPFSSRVGVTLAAGFFLVILLGFIGYFQTVRAIEQSTRRSQRQEARADQCISLAKDIALHSHEAAFFTQSYVYSGNTGDRDQQREASAGADTAFNVLQAALKTLPGTDSMQAQCAAAATQARSVSAQEEQEIVLTDHGQAKQAQNLLQTLGIGERDNLEYQLAALVGVNPTQYPDDAPIGLEAYRLSAEAAENRTERRTLRIGEAAQGVILLLSLLIAVAVIRAASIGVRALVAAQSGLRESEVRYRLLFEDNPQPMFVYSRDTLRYLAVNKTATRNYGYTEAEFLAMTILDVRPEEDHAPLRTMLEETLHRGLPLENSVWRHLTRQGALLWVEVTSLPIRWAGLEAAVVIAQDITARRDAEAGLSRLAAIVTSSHDAIVGWDTGGLVTSWNPGAERLYGWTATEIVGRPILLLVPEENRGEAGGICETLNAGNAIEMPDTTRLHKDGHRLAVWVSTSPIISAAGEVVGASTISRDISEQKKAQALIQWQAHNDPLTRLPNRAFFRGALEDALQSAAPFAVLFVDLDQFKHINDSLGHVAGDHLLREVTARFERCLERADLLARMGGDEFTLLLSGADEAEAKASALLDSLALPLLIEGHELYVAASIGISRFPADGADAETLLKHADLAMYRAKEAGRGQWQRFSPALTEAARERLTLEASLRKAIERDELILLYQPQVSLATGQIIGTEALVRWQHPELGLVAPSRFIPLAEETGLIVPLGEWVLRHACRQAALWEREGTPLRQSVNLSARQLGEADLVETVRRILEETGLNPRLLDLELTESALVTQGEAAVKRLESLRALGARISIDDFGTGYSSLAYLRRFPLDVLKVDRTFVLGLSGNDHRGRQDQAVVSAIIQMAHALGLEVVAEGVETAGQRDTLRHLGCDCMQGFLYCPPVTPERLEALLPVRVLEAA